MRLLAPLLCLTWAAVADADDIDTAIAAAVGATPPQVLVVNFNNPLCPYSPSVATELAAAKTEIMKYKDYLRILTVCTHVRKPTPPLAPCLHTGRRDHRCR